jgi:hypothetical protein
MKNISKYLGVIMVLIGLTGALAGCARPIDLQPAVNREFSNRDFSSVEVGVWRPTFLSFGNTINVPISLDVVKSDKHSLAIEANENIFEYIHISQSDKNLKILIDRNRIGTNEAVLNVKIGLPELEGMKLSGGILRANVFSSAAEFNCAVTGSSKLTVDMQTGKANFDIGSSSNVTANGSASDLRAEVSGSSRFTNNVKASSLTYIISSSSNVITSGTTGLLNAEVGSSSSLDMDLESGNAKIKAFSSSDITGKLKAADLQCEASGSSRVELEGSAANAVLKASSSSSLRMPKFTLTTADAIVSGSSNANILVNQHLNVKLSSSSRLTYTGQPVMGNVEVTGSSEIKHN